LGILYIFTVFVIDVLENFSEAITSKKDKKKIPFFHLGPNNNWKKLLAKELQIKMNNQFKDTLAELGYN